MDATIGGWVAMVAVQNIFRSWTICASTCPNANMHFLGEEASVAGRASVKDYAASVIRAELKAKAQAKLESLLLAGLEGEATEWTEADSERLLRLAATGR